MGNPNTRHISHPMSGKPVPPVAIVHTALAPVLRTQGAARGGLTCKGFTGSAPHCPALGLMHWAGGAF
eukprot:scaffold5316_cov105-Isochrysis_galbana.AAC.8